MSEQQHSEQPLLPYPASNQQLKYGRIRGVWRVREDSLRARIYIGPDFCFYVCLMTLVFISSVLTAAFSFSVKPLYFWLSLGTLLIVALFYSLVALGDPGLPQAFFSLQEREQMEIRRQQNFKPSLIHYCERCHIWRSKTTVHCPQCEVCIEGYDHHCPWVTKCVGRKTFIFFIIFVLSIAGWLVFTISALARLALAGYI